MPISTSAAKPKLPALLRLLNNIDFQNPTSLQVFQATLLDFMQTLNSNIASNEGADDIVPKLVELLADLDLDSKKINLLLILNVSHSDMGEYGAMLATFCTAAKAANQNSWRKTINLERNYNTPKKLEALTDTSQPAVTRIGNNSIIPIKFKTGSERKEALEKIAANFKQQIHAQFDWIENETSTEATMLRRILSKLNLLTSKPDGKEFNQIVTTLTEQLQKLPNTLSAKETMQSPFAKALQQTQATCLEFRSKHKSIQAIPLTNQYSFLQNSNKNRTPTQPSQKQAPLPYDQRSCTPK